MRPNLPPACLFALLLVVSGAQAVPGDFDRSFGQNGLFRLPNPPTTTEYANFVTSTEDGKVLATGNYQVPIASYGGDILARLQANGSLDPNFANTGFGRSVINPIYDTSGVALIPQFDGRVIQAQRRLGTICGEQFGREHCLPGQASSRLPVFYAQRFNHNGALDPTYGVRGIALSGGEFDDVVADSNGAFNIFGRSTAPPYRLSVVNYGPNGEPLPTGYFQTAAESLSACARLDPHAAEFRVRATDAGDGRVYVVQQVLAGNQSSFGSFLCVIRLKADGTIDDSWGTSGLVVRALFPYAWDGRPVALARRPDGGLIIVFTAKTPIPSNPYDFTSILAFNAAGAADPAWGGDNGKWISDSLIAGPDAALLQRDGKLLIAGEARTSGIGGFPTGEAPGRRLLRLHANGEPDLSFGSYGRGFAPLDSVDSRMLVKHIHEARDGAIFLAGGTTNSVDPTTGVQIYQFTVAKLLAADPPAAQANGGGSGGGGCGNITTRLPPDPTLPGIALLAALALLMKRGQRSRASQR